MWHQTDLCASPTVTNHSKQPMWLSAGRDVIIYEMVLVNILTQTDSFWLAVLLAEPNKLISHQFLNTRARYCNREHVIILMKILKSVINTPYIVDNPATLVQFHVGLCADLLLCNFLRGTRVVLKHSSTHLQQHTAHHSAYYYAMKDKMTSPKINHSNASICIWCHCLLLKY